MFSFLLAAMIGPPYIPPLDPNIYIESRIEEEKELEESEEIATVIEETGPVPFILDMDFCEDVDDACAMRIAENLHRQEEIDLKAVTLSTIGDNDQNITAIDGMLDYFGLNIPIGKSSIDIHATSPYWGVLSESSDGSYELYDAVKLWRKVISENEMTTILTTGYLSNLKAFCQSGPDEYSDKTGMELLEKTKIYIVGGSVPTGMDNNFAYEPEAIAAADWVFNNVKHPLIFITNNTGGSFKCGGKIQTERPDDQLSRALSAFGTSDGRAAWDPFGVYVSVYGNNEEAFSMQKTDIEYSNGTNTFIDSESGVYYRVIKEKPDIYYQEILDNLTIP